MKKILFVFHDSKPRSGATASMLDIIENLLKKNDLKIFALIPNTKDGLHELLVNKGIYVFEAKIYGGRHPVPNGIKDFLKYKVKSILKITVTYFSILKISRKIKLSNEKFNIIYSNTTDTYAGYFLSRLLKIKHFWHVREFGIEDQNCMHIVGDNKYYNWLKNSEKVIVISKALKNKLSQYINSDKLTLVYDDVKLTKTPLEYKRNFNGPLKILIVGTISEGKGQRFVIDAIDSLNRKGVECYLAIAGSIESEYAQWLVNYVKKNAIINISFLGFRDDIERVRLDYDIAIIASKAEAFGRVTIEAMAAGLIIVASNAGANPELIIDNKNGFLYKYNDLNSLSNIITYIYKNKEKMQAIRKNAIKFSNNFNSGLASQTIYNLIKNV